jgi:hypothetical protein
MSQTRIFAALNSTLNLSQLPRPRPGPRIDPTRQPGSSTIDSRVGPRTALSLGALKRRWEGGVAEESVLALFMERRRQIAEGIEVDESELDEYGDRIPLKRNSYTREQSLPLSITHYTHGGLMQRGKKREYHIGELTNPMLKDWIKHRNCILLQKRGSRRSRSNSVGVEEGMEHQLNDEFEKV